MGNNERYEKMNSGDNEKKKRDEWKFEEEEGKEKKK